MKDALLGFNTNVTWRGKVLHVQTEDSGRGKPHVITHLFHEGTIIVSRKTDYSHLVDAPDMVDQVRAVMKAQHKQMIIELRDKVHDEAIERCLGPDAAGVASAAPSPSGTPETVEPPDIPPFDEVPAAEPPRPAREPERPAPSQRPAAGSVRRPSFYAAKGSPAEQAVVRRPVPSGRPALPTPASPPATARDRPGSRPPGREKSGFGKDLISDKSLDEVILTYLAEELSRSQK